MRAILLVIWLWAWIFPVFPQGATRQPATWTWSEHGFGRPRIDAHNPASQGSGQYPSRITNLIESLSYWWYDWGVGCADRQVPMVYSAADLTRLSFCNDGRPVLVGNEPEYASQSNLSEVQMADLLYQVKLLWRGAIWCCGTSLGSLNYAMRIVDSYQPRYGKWPATGWHAHGYAFADSTEAANQVAGAVSSFAQVMRERNILGQGLILSEYGLLDNGNGLTALRNLEQALDNHPDLVSRAWFSTKYAPLTQLDLLNADGSLTAMGMAWRAIVGAH